jgi:peptide-methionine (S)-S-oxide reductase
MTTPKTTTTGLETATLGAGCFWCIEAVLERIDGVLEVDSGYMGGSVDEPTYKAVCDGDTGHAEVVRVTFDPNKLSYRQLLDWFFQAHDPTSLNRQGNDYGTQYRSAIFYYDEAQKLVAEAAKAAANEHYGNRVVTEITMAAKFWMAEDYHQDFFANNPRQPYCNALIPPKLKKLGLDGKGTTK